LSISSLPVYPPFCIPILTPWLTPANRLVSIALTHRTLLDSGWLTRLLPRSYRRRPLLVVATAVTEPKLRNGAGVQMVPERSVTRVDCTMPS
jgi:hypothetical protein